MDVRYNVYFAGQLLDGHTLTSVRAKLGKVFNADDQTLDKLFSGKAQLLKRDCDKATALKYKAAMEQAGAAPIIKAVEDKPAAAGPQSTTPSAADKIAALAAAPDRGDYTSPAATPVSEQQRAEPPRDIATADANITLAPPETEVLRDSERATPVTADVDTSALALDEQAERLSPAPPPPPPAPDTNHLHMGEVGETIPTLASDQQPLAPNTEGLELSAAGADLSDCAAPEPQAPQLDLSDIDLAPSGTEVLEERYRRKDLAEPPPTDHITLKE